MKRGQVFALVAGVVVGLAGVALGVVLSRREGREAAKKVLDQYGPYAQKGADVAKNVAQQASRVSGQVAKVAADQYSTQAPRAREVLSGVVAQAPQRMEAIVSALPGRNGKAEA